MKSCMVSLSMALTILVAACGGMEDPPYCSRKAYSEAALSQVMNVIVPYSSEAELTQSDCSHDEGDGGPKSDDPQGLAASATQNKIITNNQEASVDEGGIVKNIGDYLLTLRKGHLFAVSVARRGLPMQTDSIRVAELEALNEGVWYDEMIVKENNVFVIGYRYVISDENDVAGTVEIASFKLVRGRLVRAETLYLESDDYFSGQNYASRLIQGDLVLYMLQGERRHSTLRIPHYLIQSGGQFRRGKPLMDYSEVFRSGRPRNRVLHTTVVCALPESGAVSCRARGLVANWFRERYVSTSHAFHWGSNHVFALDLKTLEYTAQRVYESEPLDQFSFKHENGTLRVLVRNYLDTDGVSLLTLPVSEFNRQGGTEPQYRHIKARNEGYFNNRYVGSFVLVGSASADAGNLLAISLSRGTVSELSLSGSVLRIEELAGVGALIVTQSAESEFGPHLKLYVVSLEHEPRIVGSTSLKSTEQGEYWSHGFFFKPSATGGTLGLPIVNPNARNEWWGDGVANIAYLSVDLGGRLSLLGTISATPDSPEVCESSCFDWYGNTRPIFLGDRAFALMGNEFQEVCIGPTAIPFGPRLFLRPELTDN